MLGVDGAHGEVEDVGAACQCVVSGVAGTHGSGEKSGTLAATTCPAILGSMKNFWNASSILLRSSFPG